MSFRLILRAALFVLLAGAGRNGWGGVITGSLTDAGGSPVREMVRVAATMDMEEWTETTTNTGRYRLEVPEGVYYVTAEGAGDRSWLYRVFYPGEFNEDEAEPIWVPWEGEVADIDFVLRPGGRISGWVAAEGGELGPYEVTLRVHEVVGDWMSYIWEQPVEDPTAYRTAALPPGEYLVRFVPEIPSMYVATFYGDTWAPYEAQSVTVEPERAVEGVNVVLPIGGGVSGRLTAGGEPMPFSAAVGFGSGPGGFVLAWPLAYWFADANGDYVVTGLPEGDCYMLFIPPHEDYPQMWYDGAWDPRDADPVQVLAGEITDGINADFQPGARLSGTVLDPDGAPVPPASVTIELVGGFGDAGDLGIDWDQSGNWTASARIAPGVYSLRFYTEQEDWAYEYLGGTPFWWEGQWMGLGPGVDAAPVRVRMLPAGTISGRVLDPAGEPVTSEFASVAEVVLFRDGHELRSEGIYADGTYQVRGVYPGDYVVGARLQEFDPARPWPNVYSGGAELPEDAEVVTVEAGRTTEVDLQFGLGGVVYVQVEDPTGNVYLPFADFVSVLAVPVTPEGVVYWDALSSNDDPLSGQEGTYIVLPEGEYTLVGVPLFVPPYGGAEVPAVRRTFLGGGFGPQGAETFTIQPGVVVQVVLQMNEGGRTITGTAATAGGEVLPPGAVTLLFDQDYHPVCAHIYFTLSREGAFQLSGVPDGDYYLAALVDDPNYVVTTWYPDVPAAGWPLGMGEPPEGAGTVRVAGADVADVHITLGTVEHLQSAPRPDERRGVPQGYQLLGAYPNPFNRASQVGFVVPTAARVKLELFDLQGRAVATVVDRTFAAGTHRVTLDAGDLAGGVYFLRMKSGDFQAARKVVLTK